MIDKKLYCETFSHLRASEKAKEEVFHMREQTHRRTPKVLRAAAIAAAMTCALAVTAGAVNVATDGELFRQFTIIWTGEDSLRAVDAEGNEVQITTVPADDVVTKEDGRLILRANGEEIDITDAMAAEGRYHYEYEVAAAREGGSEEARTITIDVTGDLEEWTVTEDLGDGATITTVVRADEGTDAPSAGTETGAPESAELEKADME